MGIRYKSFGMLGKYHSEETKKRISEGHKGKHWKLKHFRKLSDEHKRKISEAQKKLGRKLPIRKGEKCNFWKGGITTPKRILFLNARRRAQKEQAEGSHIFGEWELLKKQYGYTCPACKRREPEIVLTEDHIIPLSRGGSDYIENIQPLCKSCNSKKYNKIIKKYEF